jgi:DNA-binding NarL/FixJ family response regulator
MALIVEDDPSWQELLTEMLSDAGLQVTVTANLIEALEHLKKVPYRLAIVDLSLVGDDHHNQDGLQVLDAVRRLVPGCASILLSGHVSVELAVSSIQDYGAYTCLRKENFRRAEFREVVQQALAAAPPTQDESLPLDDDRGRKSVRTSKSEEEHALGLALVVEDDAGWRSLLTELVTECGYKAHISSSYGEAQGLLKREYYQLVIADISLASSLEPNRNQDGFRLLNTIQQARIPTILVSGYADPDLIDRAYAEHKIFACFEKQSFERKAFVQTVQQISDQTLISRNLTTREIEVLTLLAQGLGNKEIASELFITTNTVKRHLKSIYAKLDVNTRAAASAFAIRLGLRPDL